MRGLDRLRLVTERLCGDEGDLRERLQAAGFEFLIAAVARESWPSALRAEAERVRAGLLTAGVADGGLWDADDIEVAWLTDDLLRLCKRAESSYRRRPAVRLSPIREEGVLC